MTDFLDDAPTKPRRTAILRETWRQERAVIFVREAVAVPHAFIAHDRAKPAARRSHLWQSKRGVRKGTPDTQLIVKDGCHLWFEFKAPGKRVIPGDDQDVMLARLRSLGDAASWGVTIEDLRMFYETNGVAMVPNAAYLALHHDGMVDSRIAKAEGGVPVAKKSRAPKPQPRFAFGKRAMARAHKAGILI